MRLLIVFFCLLPTIVYGDQGAKYVNGYFDQWLKAHNFSGYTVKDDGIHFLSKEIVLDGEIYSVNELKPGVFYTVETRLSVVLPNKRRLDDFVAGAGATPNEALLDSLNNFCLTTLHPIYAEFFEHDDTHVRKLQWGVGGKKRTIFVSDWGQRGEPVGSKILENAETHIAEAVSHINMDNDVHWAKFVLSNISGKIETLVFTIDGVQNDKANGLIKSFSWPKSKEFYMLKLFFVIGEV